ncbi:MAG: hypothetical protein QW567_03175 [Candidatus Hadarchaeales archaeon]
MATPPEEVQIGKRERLKLFVKKRWRHLMFIGACIAVAVFLIWLMLRPPEPQPAWVSGPIFNAPSENGLIAAIGENTGIENIYIGRWGAYGPAYNPREDMGKQGGAIEAVISESGQCVRVEAGRRFDIVVAVRVKTPEIAYVARENMWVSVVATSDGFTIGPENSTDRKEYVFEQSGYGTTQGYMRVNVVWDNSGNGYKLMPHENLRITWLVLSTWKYPGLP